MHSATEHPELHTQQWGQWISEAPPYAPDIDAWPENNLCDNERLPIPFSHTSPDNYNDPPLPAFKPATNEIYEASWGQVESDTLFWAADHPTGLPSACYCEDDDIFEGLPLVFTESLTTWESYTQTTDTFSQRYQQPASVRSDEQGRFAVNPHDLVLSNLHPKSPRPHSDPTQVDLLMQALEKSITSSENNGNLASGGNDETRKHRCLLCNSTFKQPAHLKVHVRSHTGEKPHHCRIPHCNSAFAQPGNLKTHELRHEGVKRQRQTRPRTDRASYSPANWYLCTLDKCRQVNNGKGKDFAQLGSLKKHMNKFHSDTLRQLHTIFTDQSRNFSPEELVLSDYFRSLYRKCNKKTDKDSFSGHHNK